jgi:hypothetical protein
MDCHGLQCIDETLVSLVEFGLDSASSTSSGVNEMRPRGLVTISYSHTLCEVCCHPLGSGCHLGCAAERSSQPSVLQQPF